MLKNLPKDFKESKKPLPIKKYLLASIASCLLLVGCAQTGSSNPQTLSCPSSGPSSNRQDSPDSTSEAASAVVGFYTATLNINRTAGRQFLEQARAMAAQADSTLSSFQATAAYRKLLFGEVCKIMPELASWVYVSDGSSVPMTAVDNLTTMISWNTDAAFDPASTSLEVPDSAITISELGSFANMSEVKFTVSGRQLPMVRNAGFSLPLKYSNHKWLVDLTQYNL